MKIAGITDIHGDLKYLEKYSKYIEEADLVLISGDITHFGGASAAAKIISEIAKINSRIFAVSGNCDYPEVEGFLESEGFLPDNIHVENGVTSYRITGKGGSLTTPMKTPNTYSENEFSYYYNKNIKEAEILITHQPPYKTFADKVFGGKHAGSKTVRSYIDDKKPLLCLCGHIHESSGMEYYGDTLVINPGPFKDGRLALIEIDGERKITGKIITG